MRERDIEAYLRDRVKALGGIAYKFVSPGHAGVADRIVCMPGGVVWFDFRTLCDGPRGKSDYIELARRFHTVIVSGVPELTSGERDVARRFVWLIDEFYDRRVKLILSAEVTVERLFVRVPLDDVYKEQKGSGEFDRTVSRLVEMQSAHYLAEPHLP